MIENITKIFPKSWGHYPPGYDPAVHGYYNPGHYYGKPDTPLAEVKLGELPAWIKRRNKSPSAMFGAISRAFWRHFIKWRSVKKPGIAGLFHALTWCTAVNYALQYENLQKHRMYRYH